MEYERERMYVMGCLENRHSPLPTTPLGTCVERSGIQHKHSIPCKYTLLYSNSHQKWAATYT